MPAPSGSRIPLALVIVAILAALTGMGLRAARPKTGAASLRQIRHVFVVIMENKDYGEVIGNPADAPYINQDVVPQAAYASQYYSAVNHGRGDGNSLPNYLWLVAGTNFGIANDHAPFGKNGQVVNSQPGQPPLTAELERAGISWRAYLGGYAGGCPLANNPQHYAVRHDPFVYFRGFTGPDPAHPAPSCGPPLLAPMAQLARDLRAGGAHVVRFNFIVPGVCDDMHDDCIGSRGWPDEVEEGDGWLSRHLPAILASPAYRDDGAVFILWDEGNFHDGGPLPVLVLSPLVRPGLNSTGRFNHSSALRTWCEIFGIAPPPPLRGAAGGAYAADASGATGGAAGEAAPAATPAIAPIVAPDMSALFLPPPPDPWAAVCFWAAGIVIVLAILLVFVRRAPRPEAAAAQAAGSSRS